MLRKLNIGLLERLKNGVSNPHLVARKLDRAFYTQLGKHSLNPKGVSIFDLDWDNLIILDACRYDIHAEITTLGGELSPRQSLAGATYEYVPANFKGRDLHDTVCLSVNGWYTKIMAETGSPLHALIDIEQKDLPPKAYDPDFEIPKPEVVTKHAKQAAAEYPNKRLIIHHNQPHYPYLGEFGRTKFQTASSSLRDAIEACDERVTREHVLRAYQENLELILVEVRELLPNLEGKTVISSDHGELLGERYRLLPFRGFGHHHGVFTDQLMRVPWHVVKDDDCKRIVSEPPQDEEIIANEQTEENLRNLGYVM